MAASSSATINGSTATTPFLFPVANTIYSIVFATSASKSLRGLNKPKYIKCYNVARSRTSLKFSSLQKLSDNFAQFNNLRSPLRLKKPLTRKEAAVINEWRLLKMEGYKEGNIEEENEAFDHHMHNVNCTGGGACCEFYYNWKGTQMVGPPRQTLILLLWEIAMKWWWLG